MAKLGFLGSTPPKTAQNGSPNLSAEAQVTEGLIAFERQAYSVAEALFVTALKLAPVKTAERLRTHLSHSLSAGRTEEALALGKALLDVFPEDFDLTNKLGHIHRRAGQLDLAKEFYRLALAKNPKYVYPQYNLAALEAGVDLFDQEAKTALDRLARNDEHHLPDFLGGPDLLNQLRQQMSASQKEEQCQEMVLLIRKKAASFSIVEIEEAIALCDQVTMLEQQEIEISEDLLELALRQKAAPFLNLEAGQPGFGLLEAHLFNLGLFLYQHKRAGAALTELDQLKAKKSRFLYLDLLRALCFFQLGNQAHAFSLLESLAKNHPRNRYVNVNLGQLYKTHGQRTEAAKYLLKTAALLEETGWVFGPSALEEQAAKLITQEKPEQAVKYLEVALENYPTPELALSLAKAHLSCGQITPAFEKVSLAFEQSRGLNGIEKKILAAGVELFDQFADLMYRSNRIKEAAQAFEYCAKLAHRPELLQKAIKLHRALNNTEKVQALEKEHAALVGDIKELQNQSRPDELMAQGKAALAKKDYQRAISAFEALLLIKPEPQAVAYLYKIYVSLKQTRALTRLQLNWKWMLEKGATNPNLS
ncbi:MAG: hypothetical protein A2600_08980 [Candidatus Lambdaproteobacteria bacterium RIFOXYD1_FULL_56_27]|uniref:Uncharacterized protein n=1 Tax=Candidatus Lambdaproteobacteria bacterium RIFOXYD2_FULL_56_26 TaxID=1817773 RepID=A0A1F6GZ34_9PROT|nr:MAG: hypothetical protein A2426_10400 [Candidatus Lambdaproteobacteria bacterium RIFOXYC1_FULL_56_13]OGH03332.1 MAG: hypothetical protein A2557_02285 [Candidatus Lambdaproteobacteria bacterium RIFOXYD2_FULL_56_26]OGH06663.1 MAG: hypothetical protein A2600_08980 [Candidatus Lambdaproteobacteria bacterium RIFOXYD1_FULL_56_27]